MARETLASLRAEIEKHDQVLRVLIERVQALEATLVFNKEKAHARLTRVLPSAPRTPVKTTTEFMADLAALKARAAATGKTVTM